MDMTCIEAAQFWSGGDMGLIGRAVQTYIMGMAQGIGMALPDAAGDFASVMDRLKDTRERMQFAKLEAVLERFVEEARGSE
jgi:2-polyprenyl-6-methoxyphenol hydroxylase-like FAD-dependent oxidoreductase